MVFDSMEQKALAYAESRHAELGDSLGFGVDGSVWLLHGKPGKWTAWRNSRIAGLR